MGEVVGKVEKVRENEGRDSKGSERILGEGI